MIEKKPLEDSGDFPRLMKPPDIKLFLPIREIPVGLLDSPEKFKSKDKEDAASTRMLIVWYQGIAAEGNNIPLLKTYKRMAAREYKDRGKVLKCIHRDGNKEYNIRPRTAINMLRYWKEARKMYLRLRSKEGIDVF